MDTIRGVLTGCDERHEWMLKWWWENYSRHNSYPVVFCDFGMTKSAQMWCASKGEVLSADTDEPVITLNEKIDPRLLTIWETIHNKSALHFRKIWFCKPFFCSSTPFDQTIWIDLDGQVKKPLSPFFTALEKAPEGFALCKDTPRGYYLRLYLGILKHRESAYQAGIFVYAKNSPVLKKWKDNCKKRNHLFFSDQDVLNRTIQEEQFNIYELSTDYNYIPGYITFANPDPLIVHYATPPGKIGILKQLGKPH